MFIWKPDFNPAFFLSSQLNEFLCVRAQYFEWLHEQPLSQLFSFGEEIAAVSEFVRGRRQHSAQKLYITIFCPCVSGLTSLILILLCGEHWKQIIANCTSAHPKLSGVDHRQTRYFYHCRSEGEIDSIPIDSGSVRSDWSMYRANINAPRPCNPLALGSEKRKFSLTQFRGMESLARVFCRASIYMYMKTKSRRFAKREREKGGETPDAEHLICI